MFKSLNEFVIIITGIIPVYHSLKNIFEIKIICVLKSVRQVKKMVRLISFVIIQPSYTYTINLLVLYVPQNPHKQ